MGGSKDLFCGGHVESWYDSTLCNLRIITTRPIFWSNYPWAAAAAIVLFISSWQFHLVQQWWQRCKQKINWWQWLPAIGQWQQYWGCIGGKHWEQLNSCHAASNQRALQCCCYSCCYKLCAWCSANDDDNDEKRLTTTMTMTKQKATINYPNCWCNNEMQAAQLFGSNTGSTWWIQQLQHVSATGKAVATRMADTNNQFTAATLVKNYKDDSIAQQRGRATASGWRDRLCRRCLRWAGGQDRK